MPPGRSRALGEPVTHHPGAGNNHHRHFRVRLPHHQGLRQRGDDDEVQVHRAEFSRVDSRVVGIHPADAHFDLNVLARGITELAHFVFEGRDERRLGAAHEPDARHALLRDVARPIDQRKRCGEPHHASE